MATTDRFADRVSTDIGRSDTQWADDTFRGDEVKGCLNTGLRIFNSSARQILGGTFKSIGTLSRGGCAEQCILIYDNIPGEFAPCGLALVLSPQFASDQHRLPTR